MVDDEIKFCRLLRVFAFTVRVDLEAFSGKSLNSLECVIKTRNLKFSN